MKKNLFFCLRLMASIVFLACLSSCSFFQSQFSSISFSLDSQSVIKAAERTTYADDGDTSSDGEYTAEETVTFLLIVKITGTYNDSKTLEFSVEQESPIEVVFEDVPVGSTGSISADVYEEYDGETIHLFTGNSGEGTVHAGTNYITIELVNPSSLVLAWYTEVVCNDYGGLVFYAYGDGSYKVSSEEQGVRSKGYWEILTDVTVPTLRIWETHYKDTTYGGLLEVSNTSYQDCDNFEVGFTLTTASNEGPYCLGSVIYVE